MKNPVMFVMVFITMLVFSPMADAANWQWVCSDTTGTNFYIDSESARIGNNGHIYAWQKYVFDGYDSRMKQRQRLHEIDGKDYSAFYYTLYNVEYEIVNENIYYHYLAMVHYNYDGTVISSGGSTHTRFFLTPGSVGMGMFKKILYYATLKSR